MNRRRFASPSARKHLEQVVGRRSEVRGPRSAASTARGITGLRDSGLSHLDPSWAALGAM
jgi:hypothetical protein